MGNYIRKTKKYSEVADTNWTKEENKILIENYNKLSGKEISLILNRSVAACRTRMYHISKEEGKIIKRGKNYANSWKIEEDNFIKKYYAKNGAEWCSKRLNRTEKACIHRAGLWKIKRDTYWKPEEDEIIRKYYPQYGSKKVSKLIGKSREVCYTRANILGVYYDRNEWTDEEIKFIKKYYPKKGAQYVSNFLGRSIKACHSKARILNLKDSKYWRKEEIEFLKEYYPQKGSVWVSKKLNRPRESCKSIASKLKIRFEDENKWTSSEIEILKKYYPIVGKFVTELLENRSESSCINKAANLGICYGKHKSAPIDKIKTILKQKDIIYKEEVGFKECFDKKMLLFDIAIYNDKNMQSLAGIIEYDGIQHFLPTALYQGKDISADKVLERTQKHDKIKNEICLVHKIPILRIKYNQTNFEELITNFLNNLNMYKKWYNSDINYNDYYKEIDDEKFKEHYIHFSKYKKNIQYKNEKKPETYFYKWTMEEDLYLEKHYSERGSKWVSKYLHRTPGACANRAHKLGLHRSNRWEREEDMILIKNYIKKGKDWCSKRLNRSISSVRHRANYLGIKNLENKWKKQEDEYIIKYYSIKTTREIANNLNRTVQAVENRVRNLKECKLDLLYSGNEAKVISISIQFYSLIKNNKEMKFLLRNDKTNYRGELYIHISQNKPMKIEMEKIKNLNIFNEIKLGYIVAKCNLVDCKNIEKKEIDELNQKNNKIFKKEVNGKYKWIIKDLEILEEPVFAKGKTGMWKYTLHL